MPSFCFVDSAPSVMRAKLYASPFRSGNRDVDRTLLVRLVAARTALAQPEAERRVDYVAARAKENIGRARRTGVIMAFAAGAGALLGLAAAWFAACAGGQVRDGAIEPSGIWDWRRRVPRN
jgi:hypothetical protein